ncbi:MAG: DUF4114 domain-containing protein [Planctomycetota bacterium]
MKKILCATVFGCVVAATSSATAADVSPIQATARPYGLQPFAPVYMSGSDARAADFNANALPFFLELINQHLAETANFTGRDGFKLDASRLFLRTQSDKPIRVYFVHEGAGYHNSLGFSMTPAGSEQPGQQHLIFPDASFNGTFSTYRNADNPLVVGDFVELGLGGPGIQLDFFCVANGAGKPYTYGGTTIFGIWHNDKERNSDGLQHAVAFLLPDSPYLLIGFEDINGGGDLDYNDCLFVVDIGEVNAKDLFDDSTLPN